MVNPSVVKRQISHLVFWYNNFSHGPDSLRVGESYVPEVKNDCIDCCILKINMSLSSWLKMNAVFHLFYLVTPMQFKLHWLLKAHEIGIPTIYSIVSP